MSRFVRAPASYLWNVPGNIDYQKDNPLDLVLRSKDDYKLRGYWIEYDRDGNLAFVSLNTGSDNVEVDLADGDDPEIVFNDSTTELEYYEEYSLVRMVAYS